jgi:hypothetical protein
MGGCTTGETVSVNPSPAASPAAIATQSFSKPLVAEKKEDKVNPNRPIPGLLQSTDPAERARQVEAGINGKRLAKDPFLNLPSITTFKGVAPIKLSSPGATTTRSSTAPSAPSPTPVNLPAPVKEPPTKQIPSPIASLPPMPDPALAKAVEVTGVVVVAGVPQAIVQAPNEASSRYVQAGQRLSNGQVLVKRIEMHGSSDPVVILEQNGVEVSKTVGSPTSGSPTAMLTRTFFFG